MNVIDKNAGAKIPYEVKGTKIAFGDDELTLDLAKLERDWPIHREIYYDADHILATSINGARELVAEIDIPEAEYVYPESDDGEVVRKPINMDNVTLTLWSID